jgi:signal transduction histidine kinase
MLTNFFFKTKLKILRFPISILIFLLNFFVVAIFLILIYYSKSEFQLVITLLLFIFLSILSIFLFKSKINNYNLEISNNKETESISEYKFSEFNKITHTINQKTNDLKNQINASNKLLYLYQNSKNLFSDGMIFLDFDMNIIDYNDQSVSLFELEINNKKELKKLTDFSNNLDLFNFYNNSKGEKYFESNITLSFPQRFFKVKSINTNKFIIIIIKNMTEYINLDITRKEFFANTSHELKTPITSMKLNLDALSNSKKNNNDLDFNFFLNKIRKDSDRLEKISNEIIDLHEIESGKLSLNIQKCDLLIFLDEIKRDFFMILKKNKVELEITIQSGFPKISIDKSMFKNALDNLISNSIRYSNPNTKIEINCYYNNNFFNISIKDYGIGLSDKDLPHIFERFYRAEGLRSEKHSGIGLSIVKQIIDVHNGEIYAESLLNEGLKISIKFPYL